MTVVAGLLNSGPIEDEETAREKLEKVGFDPKNVREVKEVSCPDGFGWWDANPICYFAGAGDLKMCRYLVTRGASTRDSASAEYEDGKVSEWFPMLAAAQNGMKNVCEWLYHHGAQGDISRVAEVGNEHPLRLALCPWSHPNRDFETAQWLILHGAIPGDFLGGHVGLRRKIADYVGVVVGRNLRTVRGIVEPLTKALVDAYERGATEQPR